MRPSKTGPKIRPQTNRAPCMHIQMCDLEFVLCAVFTLVLRAVFSLCYVQYLVYVMCSLQSVFCAVYSHEPRRFAPSMPLFARVARLARFWVQHQHMTKVWDLPTNWPFLQNNLLTNLFLPNILGWVAGW